MRARIAIASAWFAAAALTGRAARAEPPACLPGIELSAEEPLRTEVSHALSARGLLLEHTGECGVVRTGVARRGKQLVVRVDDVSGRASERAVSSAATAAALIESWVRTDYAAPLLAPPPRSIDVAGRAIVRASQDAVEATSISAPPPAHPAEKSFAVSAIAEGYVANDGAVWAGASATGQVLVGPLCLGPVIRVLSLSRTQEVSALEPHAISVEALASADIALSAGSVSLRPGLGIGAAWSSTSWEPQVGAGGAEHRTVSTSAGVRANLHFAAYVIATEHFSLGLDIAAELAPMAAAPAGVSAPGGATPGEPWVLLGVGIGARWEGP